MSVPFWTGLNSGFEGTRNAKWTGETATAILVADSCAENLMTRNGEEEEDCPFGSSPVRLDDSGAVRWLQFLRFGVKDQWSSFQLVFRYSQQGRPKWRNKTAPSRVGAR